MEDKQIYISRNEGLFKKLWLKLATPKPETAKKNPDEGLANNNLKEKTPNTKVASKKHSEASASFPKTQKENRNNIYLLSVYLLFFAIIVIISLAIVFAKK